ncbi:TniQ family protein [Rhizobium sp. 32-5/1]|uniref:TniQ family protein n=1 Tax=Rhizobium sp. 32-5/1 TaxID=3019602 RepID=UPI00240E28B3|nr:TniQ family protein [Rhizobium sp. 32-5/1]WEZ83416.1 TniQ family protein [Rhizobium sp. 32-5/1]
MIFGRRLSITVPFHSGETVLSFLSRLATANFAPSAQQFCVHMGICRAKLIQDDEEEVAKLLALAGLSQLPEGHVRVTRDDQFRYFNGETVPKYNFHRYRFRYCPHCVADDRRNNPGPLAARAFGRSIWQLLYIKNCPDHDVALVDAPSSVLDGTYEIVQMIEAATKEPFFPYATPATFTGFERYIRDRVSRQQRSPIWLDRFPSTWRPPTAFSSAQPFNMARCISVTASLNRRWRAQKRASTSLSAVKCHSSSC